MLKTLTSYEVARFYQNSLVHYQVTEYPPAKSRAQQENEKNLTRGQYNGFLSVKSKSRIKKILSPWLNCLVLKKQGKLQGIKNVKTLPTFVTLTLSAPQKHTDTEIKSRLLNNFLIQLQRKSSLKHYFWICETQKNGNLHFHMLADCFIDYQLIQKLWNESQEILGYISRFENTNGHRNPNSTDIHAVESIESIEAYVMKYVSKGGGERVIKGKIWDCSTALKSLKPLELIVDSNVTSFICQLRQSTYFHKFNDENFSVYCGDIIAFSSVHNKPIHEKLIAFYQTTYYDLYGDQIPIDKSRAPIARNYIEYVKPLKPKNLCVQLKLQM